jgi:hypothetical protein
MGTFFHSPDGRLRGFRVGACCYVFNVLLSLIGDGWRSLSWIAWFLLAFGFFAMAEVEEGPKWERSKWHSPAYLVGVIAAFLGCVLLLYRIYSK